MIRRAFAVFAACFFAVFSSASGETIPGPINVKVLRVIDGDTFVASALIWPGLRQEVSVRIRGIDAPEMRGRCARERRMGKQATQEAKGFLSKGGVQLRNVSLDRYGRALADVTIQEIDLGEALRRRNLAVPYDGGKRKGFCQGGAAPLAIPRKG